MNSGSPLEITQTWSPHPCLTLTLPRLRSSSTVRESFGTKGAAMDRTRTGTKVKWNGSRFSAVSSYFDEVLASHSAVTAAFAPTSGWLKRAGQQHGRQSQWYSVSSGRRAHKRVLVLEAKKV